MKISKLTVVAAALVVSTALAGASTADDALDTLTPMNSDGLGGVKGAVAAEEETGQLLVAAPGPTSMASSLEGASTLSGNEANNVGLGVISLTNSAENSVLSLSGSLLNGAANSP